MHKFHVAPCSLHLALRIPITFSCTNMLCTHRIARQLWLSHLPLRVGGSCMEYGRLHAGASDEFAAGAHCAS